MDRPWTADRIAALRKQLGDTQEDFAARVGVTFVSVNCWEKGHSKPSKLATQALERLESVLVDTRSR